MNPWDILIVLAIGAAVVAALVSIFKRRGTSCCGSCEGCSGCGSCPAAGKDCPSKKN